MNFLKFGERPWYTEEGRGDPGPPGDPGPQGDRANVYVTTVPPASLTADDAGDMWIEADHG